MIGVIIFVIALITAVVVFASNPNRVTKRLDRYSNTVEEFNPRSLFLPIVILIGGNIISIVQPYSLEKIDAGNVGLRVNLTGNNRGVSKSTYVSGWNMYNTWTSDLHQYPTTIQTVEYPEQQVITKGGFAASIHPTFNYTIVPGTVSDMFQNLRVDIKEIEQSWLKNAITSSVNDVANIWEVDSIFNHRSGFEAAIVVECNKRVSKWFNVSQLKTNIVPPASLQQAIEGKTRAIQETQAAIQRKQVAEAEAQEKIAIAKGDSAQAVIAASGEAAATRLKQQQLTPLYVEYLKIKKWDGQLPTTTVGGAGALINIK